MKTYENIKYAFITLVLILSISATQAMAEVDWFDLNRGASHNAVSLNTPIGNDVNRQEYSKGQIAGIQAADFCPSPAGLDSRDIQARAESEKGANTLLADSKSRDFVNGYKDGYVSTFNTNATYCLK